MRACRFRAMVSVNFHWPLKALLSFLTDIADWYIFWYYTLASACHAATRSMLLCNYNFATWHFAYFLIELFDATLLILYQRAPWRCQRARSHELRVYTASRLSLAATETRHAFDAFSDIFIATSLLTRHAATATRGWLVWYTQRYASTRRTTALRFHFIFIIFPNAAARLFHFTKDHQLIAHEYVVIVSLPFMLSSGPQRHY